MTFLFWYENNNRSFIGLFYCYYFKEMRGCSGLLTSAGISGYGCQEVRRHTERRACRQAMEAWAQWKPVLPSCKVVLKLAPMVLMRPACEFKQPVCVCVCVCWGRMLWFHWLRPEVISCLERKKRDKEHLQGPRDTCKQEATTSQPPICWRASTCVISLPLGDLVCAPG